MMISLSDAGKRFNREWIFRHFTYTFEEGRSYAITGPNGSGKSTLMQVIGGAMHINEGNIAYQVRGQKIERPSVPADTNEKQKPGKPGDTGLTPETGGRDTIPQDGVFTHVSFCAPYLEIVEEMTLKEFLDFHHGFKPLIPGITIEKIVSILGLEKAANKQIRYYSSGMKQRAKLAQCIFSDTAIVLLDEPCTNLDAAGIELYHQLVNDYCKNRLVIVSSNDEVEYSFCEEKIEISNYKS